MIHIYTDGACSGNPGSGGWAALIVGCGETIKLHGGEVDTTNNFADGATHTFSVLVSASGVVTYQIDGSAPTTTLAQTFDDGDVVIPFFYGIGAATGDPVTLVSWFSGHQ